LEPLLWLHCSISGRCLLDYMIGTEWLWALWWQGRGEQAAAYSALEGESLKEQEEWRHMCEGLKVAPHPPTLQGYLA